MGTKFTVYDNGVNPMKTTGSLEASSLRQELAAICYVSTTQKQSKKTTHFNTIANKEACKSRLPTNTL